MGTQHRQDDAIINFPKGLIGLSEQTQLQLFHDIDNNDPTVHWLQSLSDEQFSMSVISPESLGMEYQIEFDKDDLQSLQLDDPKDALVLLVVYKQVDEEDSIKVVTKAPIVVNPKAKRGLQKALDETIFH